MLKIKLSDQDTENRRLKDFINKVEPCNNELQQTIRTLERKLNLLETNNNGHIMIAPVTNNRLNYISMQGSEDSSYSLRLDYENNKT